MAEDFQPTIDLYHNKMALCRKQLANSLNNAKLCYLIAVELWGAQDTRTAELYGEYYQLQESLTTLDGVIARVSR